MGADWSKCEVCHKPNPDMFRVSDELWLKHFQPEDFVCHECFEKKLGRKLTLDDLEITPYCNKWFIEKYWLTKEP